MWIVHCGVRRIWLLFVSIVFLVEAVTILTISELSCPAIFAMDGCRDFALLVRTNLCTEDQNCNLGDLLRGYDNFFYKVSPDGLCQPLSSASDQKSGILCSRRVHKLWFIVVRFLFHSPLVDCAQLHEDNGWCSSPTHGKGQT